ncbi:hypothetical protein GCM10022262_42560 [Georgenia daeguensis]|uniref:Uncharacterized protein n=1 Tax=Georgenia daeguensis TaxID=908355 RepID=A0ABP6URL4_9MICO
MPSFPQIARGEDRALDPVGVLGDVGRGEVRAVGVPHEDHARRADALLGLLEVGHPERGRGATRVRQP